MRTIFFTPLGIISLATRTISTLLWILDKSYLKPKLAYILFNYMDHLFHLHQLGWWPMTSSTSLYELGSRKDSRLMACIISLILMESDFSNKSSYLHKTTLKPMANYLIFNSWSKLISLIGDTFKVMVWRAKKYVQ